MGLFEKIDLARSGDESYNEDIKAAFKNKLKADRVAIFKEYVYYAFPDEHGYQHTEALEFFLWLKGLEIQI